MTSSDPLNWLVAGKSCEMNTARDGLAPVVWVRHFVLLKGVGVLLVDQLQSEREHDYTWLFHLLPCSPVRDKDLKSVYTGFAEKNILLLPAVSPASPAAP